MDTSALLRPLGSSRISSIVVEGIAGVELGHLTPEVDKRRGFLKNEVEGESALCSSWPPKCLYFSYWPHRRAGPPPANFCHRLTLYHTHKHTHTVVCYHCRSLCPEALLYLQMHLLQIVDTLFHNHFCYDTARYRHLSLRSTHWNLLLFIIIIIHRMQSLLNLLLFFIWNFISIIYFYFGTISQEAFLIYYYSSLGIYYHSL